MLFRRGRPPTMTHYNDRVRCAVEAVGISNFVTFLEHTEAYRRDLRRVEYGDQRDPKIRDFLPTISPATQDREAHVHHWWTQGSARAVDRRKTND